MFNDIFAIISAVESWAGPQGRPQKGRSCARKSNEPHPFSRDHALLCTAITLLLDGNEMKSSQDTVTACYYLNLPKIDVN